MSYRVEFHVAALSQLEGLPPKAFEAMVERVVALPGSPWDTQPLAGDQPEFRQTVFGNFGLLSFHVHPKNELIRIFDVTWAG